MPITPEEFVMAASNGHINTMELYRAEKGDINAEVPAKQEYIHNGMAHYAVEGETITALHAAASNGHRRAVVWLCLHKANVNKETARFGRTAISIALEAFYLDSALNLANCGADPYVKDRRGGEANAMEIARNSMQAYQHAVSERIPKDVIDKMAPSFVRVGFPNSAEMLDNIEKAHREWKAKQTPSNNNSAGHEKSPEDDKKDKGGNDYASIFKANAQKRMVSGRGLLG